RGEAKISQESSPNLITARVFGSEADQAVDLRTPQGDRIVDGVANPFLEFVFPAGQAGDAPFASVPIPRRQIVKDQDQIIALEGVSDVLLRERIRKHELNGAKTVRARGCEAVKEPMLVVEHRKVGGKPRHERCPKVVQLSRAIAVAPTSQSPGPLSNWTKRSCCRVVSRRCAVEGASLVARASSVKLMPSPCSARTFRISRARVSP